MHKGMKEMHEFQSEGYLYLQQHAFTFHKDNTLIKYIYNFYTLVPVYVAERMWNEISPWSTPELQNILSKTRNMSNEVTFLPRTSDNEFQVNQPESLVSVKAGDAATRAATCLLSP